MRCNCVSILSLLLCAVLFVGCRDKSTDDLANQLCKNIESNTKIIRSDINAIITKLGNDIDRAEFRDKAIPVYKKVSLCNEYSLEIIKNIEFLQLNESLYLQTLQGKLKAYINQMKDIDTAFYNQRFAVEFAADKFNKKIDSIAIADVSKENTNLYLIYLKNEVSQFELSYIKLQNRQIILGCGLNFNTTIPVISQNTLHLKANEQLTIAAGVGMYASNTKTRVFIDGKLVSQKFDGYVEYKTFVTGKKGNYSKQVVVEYVQPYDTANVKRYQCDVKYVID